MPATEPPIRDHPHLACHQVDFDRGRRRVIESIDLAIARGEWVGIIGPNGAGKTTLLDLLAGWLSPAHGEIRLGPDPLRALSPQRLAQRLAVVPQAAPLVFGHRVAEVVAMGRHPHQGPMQWTLSPDDDERVRWALERTGTSGLATRRFNELSGGERQLVLLARALAQSTETLLLDEPTAALDLHHQARVIDVLTRLHRGEGSTILWVAHDLNLVGRVCGRLLLMADGRIVADGTPAEILTPERLSEAYQTAVRVDVAADGHRRVEIEIEQVADA